MILPAHRCTSTYTRDSVIERHAMLYRTSPPPPVYSVLVCAHRVLPPTSVHMSEDARATRGQAALPSDTHERASECTAFLMERCSRAFGPVWLPHAMAHAAAPNHSTKCAALGRNAAHTHAAAAAPPQRAYTCASNCV